MSITVRKITPQELDDLGVKYWPVWEKEISFFDWKYDEGEEFYVLDGEIIIYAGGKEYKIVPGDFVSCFKGLECKWKIVDPVRKHYRFI